MNAALDNMIKNGIQPATGKAFRDMSPLEQIWTWHAFDPRTESGRIAKRRALRELRAECRAIVATA